MKYSTKIIKSLKTVMCYGFNSMFMAKDIEK